MRCDVIPTAISRFPWKGEPGTIMTMSHKLWREVNAICDERLCQQQCGKTPNLWVRVSSLAPEPDFWYYRGMTLQARRTDGKRVLNSVLYTVLSASAKEAVLRRPVR